MDVVDLTPPSPWPPRIAGVLGVLCLLAAGISWTFVADAAARVQSVEQSMESFDAQANPEGFKALRGELRVLKRQETRARQRRLGFALAGFVLVVGGFLGSGLLRLHQKMSWAVSERDIDYDEDAADDDEAV